MLIGVFWHRHSSDPSAAAPTARHDIAEPAPVRFFPKFSGAPEVLWVRVWGCLTPRFSGWIYLICFLFCLAAFCLACCRRLWHQQSQLMLSGQMVRARATVPQWLQLVGCGPGKSSSWVGIFSGSR